MASSSRQSDIRDLEMGDQRNRRREADYTSILAVGCSVAKAESKPVHSQNLTNAEATKH